MIHSEKLSSIGIFVSGVAHELNNPLTSIMGFSNMLASRTDLPEDVVENLKIINTQTNRATKIVKNLLPLSRRTQPGKTIEHINGIVNGALGLNELRMRADHIEIEKTYTSEPAYVKTDVVQLQQVFINILLNASQQIKSVQQKGKVTVTTEIHRSFDPFFTTKEIGKGTGLGLYVSFSIIKEHGGNLWAENLGDSGVKFIITLPQTEPASPKLHKTSLLQICCKELHLLFVDDDQFIRSWLKGSLSDDTLIKKRVILIYYNCFLPVIRLHATE